MTIEMLDIIPSAISAISAVVVACVAWAALRRFKSQKWWERRVDSYLKVLDALADASTYYDCELSADVRGAQIPDDQHEELVKRARRADQEVAKAIDLAELFISEHAHQRLIQYKRDIARAERTVNDDRSMRTWFQCLDEGLDAITRCQADMIKIAKKDLELPSR